MPDPAEAARQRVREANLRYALAAIESAQRAIAGTLGGAEAARLASAVAVPADDAGEYTLRVHAAGPDEWEARGVLTWRQAEAMRHLGRVRRKAGLPVAWLRHLPGGERPEEMERAALAEYNDLMALVHEPVHSALAGMLGTGEWSISVGVTQVRVATDAVADRLGLAR